MNSGEEVKGAALLKHALDTKLHDSLEKRKQLNQWKNEYELLHETLRTLPDKISHQAMIPIGQHSIAFMPGSIKNTNQVYCPLGQNYFVLCSASHARTILNRRILYIVEQLNEIEGELDSVCARLTADEINTSEKEIEKVGNAELIKRGEFVEIRELEFDEGEEEETKSTPPKQTPPATKEDGRDDLDKIFAMWDAMAEEEENSVEEMEPEVVKTENSITSPSDIFNTPQKIEENQSGKTTKQETPTKPTNYVQSKDKNTPFSGQVVEKNVTAPLPTSNVSTEKAPKRVSRFKAQRNKK